MIQALRKDIHIDNNDISVSDYDVGMSPENHFRYCLCAGVIWAREIADFYTIFGFRMRNPEVFGSETHNRWAYGGFRRITLAGSHQDIGLPMWWCFTES